MLMNATGETIPKTEQHKDDQRSELRSSSEKYCVRRPIGQATPEQQFVTKFKRSLGNITTANSDTITPQLTETFRGVKDQYIWKESTKAILQRAMMDDKQTNAYLTLCAKIAHQNAAVSDDGNTFGSVMTYAFEEEVKQRLDRPCGDAEEQQANKSKLLAGTKFIGELAKKNIIEPTLLLEPINSVFKNMDTSATSFTPSDVMCVECVCTLLNLIGKPLDIKAEHSATDKLYTATAELGENKNIVARVRFMAKDLSELRANKWLPRALTKKLDENAAAAAAATSSSPATATTPSSPLSTSSTTSPTTPTRPLNNNGSNNTLPILPLLDEEPLTSDDAELLSMMECFASKLKALPDTKAASVFRKFTQTISQDHVKALVSVLSEMPATDCCVATDVTKSPWSGRKKVFRRPSTTTLANMSPMSPPTLSRNFHAAINLIKLNNSGSFSDEMGSSLLTKVDTLQASELTELVGSIFRKMCEGTSEESYLFCIVLITRLASESSATHSFKDTLEACCQDESVLKMFSTQGAMSLYMKMLKDMRTNLNTNKEIIRNCISKIQHGLFELCEEEMRLLSELENICGSTQFTYHPHHTTTTTTPTTTSTTTPTHNNNKAATTTKTTTTHDKVATTTTTAATATTTTAATM